MSPRYIVKRIYPENSKYLIIWNEWDTPKILARERARVDGLVIIN